MLDPEVVCHQCAIEGPDAGAKGIQGVVDHLRRVEQMPGQYGDRPHCGDHAAAEEVDVLWPYCGEVVGRRHEVGHDVDADSGDHECRRPDHCRGRVVDARHHFHRIVDILAEP